MLWEFFKWFYTKMFESTRRRFTIGDPADEELAIAEVLEKTKTTTTPIIVVHEDTVVDGVTETEASTQAVKVDVKEVLCVNCANNNNVKLNENISNMNLSSTEKAALTLLSPAQAQRTIK
ncbi:unnamed protein product [Ceratitis capitata]|uniref:(Mediterranean fruit fly) hypothetical protein n=1 Tax=Ceratitis capitata TaxID=7213 RepID=A0A811VEE4_CERCA|nr:unnamed protein product [Ceratitis capitata]